MSKDIPNDNDERRTKNFSENPETLSTPWLVNDL